ADGAIIDDPVKGRKDANSETVQIATWDAYLDDVMTRLVPGGWAVIIMTRWAVEDLGGKILPEGWNGESGMFECRDGRTWEVLCLQAKCETQTDPLGRKIGEYLWPQWFDREHWIPFEREPRSWNSLYQQRPRPSEGAFFHERNLLMEAPGQEGVPPENKIYRPVESVKNITLVFATADTAVRTGKERDGTGVVYWGLSLLFDANLPEDNRTREGKMSLTILDWDYRQIDGATLEVWFPTVFARLEELAKEVRALRGSAGVFIEQAMTGSVLVAQLQNRGFAAKPIESGLTAMGKVERAVNASGYVFSGKVKFSRAAYEKVIEYKGRTRNHLLSQILIFDPEVKDQGEDDLLDAASYGIAIGLGNPDGF
ncbi:MAG: hypothetical protein KGL35_14215, partial [Bradyrhizobium sp.]|nr:hypothetical protein [Bradyrhizobium sp.]